ncbi:phenylalanine--tRNA ligase alpha subunit-like [Ptychodera flava]|uniref:phenylalanine--tRNA ligase alpha subunit-like n=1 Tax=Ptychodera flava TaxID=63121 RepID=UPI00396A6EA1
MKKMTKSTPRGQDVKQSGNKMGDSLGEKILQEIEEQGNVNTEELAKRLDIDHQQVVGAVKSLQSLGNLINSEQKGYTKWELTEEGKSAVTDGSPESVVYQAVPPDTGILQAELMKSVPNAKVGFSKAMSAGWLLMDKNAEGGPRVKRKADSIVDKVQEQLKKLSLGDYQLNDKEKVEYKKRKLMAEVTVKYYVVSKGSEFSTEIRKQETDLTPEMIMSGSWKTHKFKSLNFDALGVPPTSGHLHPLQKVRTEFRQIFLELGFTEMPTNNFVESSFWNFDALFQPQQHPARDAHDTFFIDDPMNAHDFPMDYLERVKKIHSEGGYGSQGYRYDWKIEEAKKNLLRTHTTAVSARMLYKLAQKPFRPAKFFSIDRVFRNETLDATHLAEFHQIEGVVAERGLTLGHLIGVLHSFFKKLGIEKLRFKPAYNPYTEPSMEIFSYHDGLKKWVEVGNSGVFRPEMLLPMGLPEDVSVIAWGLSLERPTMIKYKINNIRDLVGHKVDLQMVQNNPVCRLDK